MNGTGTESRVYYPIKKRSARLQTKWIAALIIAPLGFRVLAGLIVPFDRTYDSINIGSLVSDPSFIAFEITGFLVLLALAHLGLSCLRELFRAPLAIVTMYGAMATIFGIFSTNIAYNLWLAIELFAYYFIAAIMATWIRRSGGLGAVYAQRYFYLFFAGLVILAIVDMLLPSTYPFEFVGGRNRFAGAIIRLEESQWSAIGAAVVLMSVVRVIWNRGARLRYFSMVFLGLIVCIAAGSRASLVAIFTAGFIMAFVALKRLTRFEKYLAGACCVFIVIVGFTVTPMLNWGLIEESASEVVRITDTENVKNLGGRLTLWRATAAEIAKSPLIGRGIGWRAHSTHVEGSIHNAYLEAWLASGAIGVLALCLGLVLAWLRLATHSHMMAVSKSTAGVVPGDVALGAACLLVYAMVHGLTESSLAGVNNIIFLFAWYSVTIAQSTTGMRVHRGPRMQHLADRDKKKHRAGIR